MATRVAATDDSGPGDDAIAVMGAISGTAAGNGSIVAMSGRRAGPRGSIDRCAAGTLAVVLVVGGWFLTATPVAASGAEQQAVDRSVAAASNQGIQQSIAVVDRHTGERVAGSGGDQQYISESIVKLFTVAYYELQAGGQLDDAMAQTLRTMIVNSDDRIESSLWNTDIVPTVAERYGLGNTRNGPRTGPHDWGWELITADDEATFLFRMSNDPQVAPLLMDAMANVASTGSDGFDQHFGMNTLTGDHGSKQGWTDVGSTDQVQIHSVGWTDTYFVAILQTSTGAGYDAMTAAATDAAHAVLRAEAPDPRTSSGSAPSTTSSPASPQQPSAARLSPQAAAGFTAALTAVRREIRSLVEGLTGR